MTKKDYELFVEMFRVEVNRARLLNTENEKDLPRGQRERAYGWLAALSNLISETADLFQSDNHRFDRDRFFKAIYQ